MIGYKDFSQYMDELFPGQKVQKISINAGFSCPNRDGTIGTGGCIYCDNTSFTPGYCFDSHSVKKQIVEGKRFFARKYPQMKYLAYFQSFSNTFGKSPSELLNLYQEAATEEDVVGIIIGTRPDAIDESTVGVLERLIEFTTVIVELGAETSHDSTLDLINRGHKWSDVEDAAVILNKSGIHVGLHLIMGLPGESKDMQLETVKRASALPIDSLKFHQLQILKNTPLAEMMSKREINVAPYNLDEYLELCVRLISLVPSNIAIERFAASAPQDKLIAPKWGLKNYEFTNLLKLRLNTHTPKTDNIRF